MRLIVMARLCGRTELSQQLDPMCRNSFVNFIFFSNVVGDISEAGFGLVGVRFLIGKSVAGSSHLHKRHPAHSLQNLAIHPPSK